MSEEEKKAQEAEFKKAQEMLEKMDTDREKGLEALERQLDAIDDVTGVATDVTVETRLKSISAGLRGVLRSGKASQQLISFMKQDLIVTIESVQKLTKDAVTRGIQLDVIATILEQKEIISSDERETVFKKIVEDLEGKKNKKPSEG